MKSNDERGLLREAFAPARRIEPTREELAAVIARAQRAPIRSAPRLGASWRPLAAGLAALFLFAGLYAVPETRATLQRAADDVAAVFDGWNGSDSHEAPGRALRSGEQAPDYFRSGSWARQHVRDPRVIAAAGGYKLFAFRERNGSIGFDLGDTGIGTGGFHASDFDDRALYVLGPGSMERPDRHGRIPWFGIAAHAVTSVELTYETGPPLRVKVVEGGFVLLAKPARGPREIIALGANGEILGRKSIAFATS